MAAPYFKRTPSRVKKLLNALRSGMTRRAACAAAGIHHATLYNWLQEDSTLSTQIEHAENEAEQHYTQIVADAALKDPHYSIEWLKRRRGAEWGEKSFVQSANVNATVSLEIDAENLTDDEIGRKLENLLQLYKMIAEDSDAK